MVETEENPRTKLEKDIYIAVTATKDKEIVDYKIFEDKSKIAPKFIFITMKNNTYFKKFEDFRFWLALA